MHRGSSKGARSTDREPETLPLSASSPLLRVELVVTRAGRTEEHVVEVPPGSAVRLALKQARLSPEGCAVLEGAQPWPLDRTVVHAVRLTVVPTFSGG